MSRILPGETDIYAITDARISLGRSLEEVALALLGAGVRLLQYREKNLKGGKMLEECRLLRRLTREAGACFIVNDHVDIAMLVGADGSAERVALKKSSGFDALDSSALDTVRRWRFVPGKRNGLPVAMEYTVPIAFRLE